MATNKKISELTEFTAAQMADDDLIVMVDVSDSTTKKVQASTFRATVSGVSTLSADSPLSVDAATGDVTMSLGTVAINKGGTGATDAATARTNLGLGTIATQDANNVNITGGSITGITDLAVADGGTGASDAPTARTNLGLGSISTQSASSVSITGGSITGITDLAVADGGTGASDAATARTNLGLGSISTQSASNVSITGGTITGITDLAVADGGTGASDAATARTNLGVTVTNISDQSNSSTGWLDLPVGTTAQRGSPTSGAVRYNTDDSAFEGYNGSAWGALGGGNTTSKGLWENNATISSDYTITTGNNALSAGPITVDSGVTVTVPSGSTWTVV